jgi:hypothetical protein
MGCTEWTFSFFNPAKIDATTEKFIGDNGAGWTGPDYEYVIFIWHSDMENN